MGTCRSRPPVYYANHLWKPKINNDSLYLVVSTKVPSKPQSATNTYNTRVHIQQLTCNRR